MKRGFIQVAWSILTLATAVVVSASTYYVDYQNGSDTQAGTSTAAAWKHAPGDGNATGNANRTLTPGDTVKLKGGVVYRGSISIGANGAAGNPVVYKGDGWGVEKAIIDGTAPFGSTWTQCASASEVRGNVQYQNIYYTSAPAGYTDFTTGLYEDSKFLWYSQSPNPTDPFYYDRIEYFTVIPLGSPTISQTRTTITDAQVFIQSDAAYWNDAFVAVWRQPNVTVIKKITGYNPATHTITHEDLGGDIYTDRNTFYSILNHPGLIDRPGEYFFDPVNSRIYVWPLQSDNPAGHSFSVLNGAGYGNAIWFTNRRYVVIEGFLVRCFSTGIRSESGSDNVIIRNNEITTLRSNDWYALQAGGTTILVEQNRLIDCQRAVGILLGGTDVIIKGNYLRRVSRQGIWLMGGTHCEIINNTVIDCNGTHANGISCYLGNLNTLVAGNRILNTGSALTYHGNGASTPAGQNLYICNNIIENAANSWNNNMQNVYIINNTFLGALGSSAADGEVVSINNIVHGGGYADVYKNNLYTALNTDQRGSGWVFGAGEVNWSQNSRDQVFAGVADSNYHLRPGSPAVNTGTDPTPYLPIALFPDYDFTKDIDGNARVQGTGWDMGAYESDGVRPNAPTGLTAPLRTAHVIGLAWTAPAAASDGDLATSYIIKRDGTQAGTSFTTAFNDSNLAENTSYSYQVYAADDFENLSASAATAGFATIADAVGPMVRQVLSLSLTATQVFFDEPVDQATSEAVSSYQLTGGVTVVSAVLQADQKSVLVTTSIQTEGSQYTITVSNVRDASAAHNTMTSTPKQFAAMYKFEDNFEAGNISKWTPASSSVWTVTDDAGDKSLFINAAVPAERLLINRTYNLLSFDVDLKGYGASTYRNLSIIIASQDTSNYYHINFAGAANTAYNGIFKVVNRTETRLATAAALLTETTQYHHVRVTWDGDLGEIKAFFDQSATPVFSAVDTTYRSGKCGVWSKGSKQGYFDNVEVVSYIRTDAWGTNIKNISTLTPEQFMALGPNPLSVQQLPALLQKGFELFDLQGTKIDGSALPDYGIYLMTDKKKTGAQKVIIVR